MELEVNLSRKEITKAIQFYMLSKGYKVESLGYDTSCRYSRVLFDTELESWLNGAKLKVTKINK